MAALDAPIFDADHHLYETEEAFTRHLSKADARLFSYVTVGGRTKIAVRGVISDYIPNPTFEVVARPGSHMAYYSGNNPEGRSLREMAGEPMRSVPAFRNPADRLVVLDAQGIDAAVVYPTLASLIEERFLDDPDLTVTMIHAYNEWLLDEWTFNFKNRVFATPLINPCVLERGIAELEWALDRGARVLIMRPGPVAGPRRPRSPFLAEFDPFWARVQEAGIPVALHLSDSGYQRYINEWEGIAGEFVPFAPSSFTVAAGTGRAITDTFFSAICHGMLTRFPDVKLLSVENGGSWVLPALKVLDGVYKKMPQDFTEHPRDTFLRSVYVNPFWEDSIDDLIGTIGSHHVLFGSDWPHPEGLADPASWVEGIRGHSDADVRRMMGGNLYDLIGLTPPR